ncbi:MAG: SPOR domain-containing protein [Pseudomonadota bacterium]
MSDKVDDQWSELANLVGDEGTLQTAEGERLSAEEAQLPEWTNATEDTAPDLNFNLEDELSRAFGNVGSGSGAEPLDATSAVAGLEEAFKQAPPPIPVFDQGAIAAETQETVETASAEPAPSQPLESDFSSAPSMHFNSMVSEQLDQAMAQETNAIQQEPPVDAAAFENVPEFLSQSGSTDAVAADVVVGSDEVASLEEAGVQPASAAEPEDDIVRELARLMDDAPESETVSAASEPSHAPELSATQQVEVSQPADVSPPVVPTPASQAHHEEPDLTAALDSLSGIDDFQDSAPFEQMPEPLPEPAPEAPVSLATPVAPAPSEVAMPWTEAEIVSQPYIAPAAPVEAAPVADVDSWESEFMQDFSDPAAEFQDYEAGVSQEAPAAPVENPAPAPVAVVAPVAAATSAMSASSTPHYNAVRHEQVGIDPVTDMSLEEFDDKAFDDALAAELSADEFQAAPADRDASDIAMDIPPAAVIAASQARPSGKRAAMVVGAVALLGGVVALGWNFIGGSDSPAPTILASSEPVKIKPEKSGGEVVPNQDQAVYRSVDGETSETDQSSLNDTTEQPITVVGQGTDDKIQQRVQQADNSTTGALGLQPRRVRTVTVRPDGTIVTSGNTEQAAAPSTSETIADPQLALNTSIPADSGADETAATGSTNGELVYNAPKALTSETAAAVTQGPSTNVQPVEVKPAETAPAAPETVQVAAVEPATSEPDPAPAAVEPKPAAPKSPYAVQLSSQRSDAAARQSFENISKRYASILSGMSYEVQKSDIKGKGTYYRLRVPMNSRAEAQEMCSKLKAQGGDCFVTK